MFSKHGAEISGDSTNYGSDIFQSYYNNNIEIPITISLKEILIDQNMLILELGILSIQELI